MRGLEHVPLWLRIHERIDFYMWVLGTMTKNIKVVTPLEAMIDDATGYKTQGTKKFIRVQRHLLRLKKLYDRHAKPGT